MSAFGGIADVARTSSNRRDCTWLCENAALDVIRAILFPHDLRGVSMKRFMESADRSQSTLFPECVEDCIGEDNPVRVIDVLVDDLDLAELGFGGVEPEATGRPSCHLSI